MRAAGIHRLYPLLTLTALIFCASIVAANAQKGSAVGVREASSVRISELLSDKKIEDSEAIEAIFKFGDKAVPTLVRALQDRKDLERAVWALAYLAGPKERKLLFDAIPREKDKEMKSFISDFLAGALVEPASEEEWNFLATCIKEYRNEDQVLATEFAILALGENGSQRALHILQAIEPAEQPRDPDSDVADAIEEIHHAVRWITQKPPYKPNALAETRSDLEQVKQIVLENAFYAEGERADLSVEDVILTDDKSRALASVEIYHGPKNARGYDIVLERRHSGTWGIIGIWVTWLA